MGCSASSEAAAKTGTNVGVVSVKAVKTEFKPIPDRYETLGEDRDAS